MLITESTRYLIVPTSSSAPVSKLRLFSGERLLLDLDAHVDFALAETVMYYDLRPFIGLDVRVGHESGKSFGFSQSKPEPISEPSRPLLHFTAGQGWLNDPNGLIYYEGQYHLFFQHNPVGRGWGNMHWGHAVSNDLISWHETDIALYPDELGDMFSGSAIIDRDNLLGLKENEHDPLLLFYTAAGGGRELNAGAKFTQCLAYSTDGAKTFRKYAKNPIVPHIKGGNRDPKVIRDPDSGVYIMALYLDGDEYMLLVSDNLTDWKPLQTINLRGDNECPDFYPLTDSDGRRKWVLTGAHDCCVVGDFDPERGFTNLSETRKFGFGAAYAAQSFEGADGRRLRFSWNRFTDMPSRSFNCEMSVPCEMKLCGGSLRIAPARELYEAVAGRECYENLPAHGISREITLPCLLTLELSRIEEAITINLCGNLLRLDAAGGLITVNGGETMPLCVSAGKVGLQIIADNYGIEIFDLDGRVFGAFAAPMHGSQLIIGGEGSLDRLTVNRRK